MVLIYDWSGAGPPAKLTNVQKLQVDQTGFVLTELIRVDLLFGNVIILKQRGWNNGSQDFL